MNHNQHPNQESKKPGKGRLARLGAAMSKFAEGATAEGVVGTSVTHIKRLAAGAVARGPENPRNLGRESERLSFKDTLLRKPLVEKVHNNGSSEGITHLVILGDKSVVAIARTMDRYNQMTSMRASLLPIGTARHEGSATLLYAQNSDLEKPGRDGVVQPWVRVELGREVIASKGGEREDDTVSRSHADITFSSRGDMTITDAGSTNGTQVISMDDFNSERAWGMTPEAQEELFGVVGTLKERGFMWQTEFADAKHVVVQA